MSTQRTTSPKRREYSAPGWCWRVVPTWVGTSTQHRGRAGGLVPTWVGTRVLSIGVVLAGWYLPGWVGVRLRADQSHHRRSRRALIEVKLHGPPARPPARSHACTCAWAARAFARLCIKRRGRKVRKRESLLPTPVHMHARAQLHACSIASTALPTFAEYVAGTGEYLTATALRNGLCHDA